ncbi:retrovirus-related pol polyprotein from transposon TNT 1-94, partial [Tanacetum coccineum]
GLPKIDETHALSKPVTSNSIPTPQESKVMKNDNVIALGMFRINPFKASREEKFMPNKLIKASVRTQPITVSQLHVLTKKGVNSNSNGLSSTGVDNTTKTKRPQPRSNTKNDKVPSASKSSYNKNKEVEVEEHPKNLLLSKNKKHMSSECNNIKLAIRNDKSEVVGAMCKQCLITSKYDVCVLNYVNDMNSRADIHSVNVSNIANQKKHKPQAKKPKKVGSKERLALPKPSDNACTDNPQEPISKQFPNSTFSLAGHLNLFMFLGTIRFVNGHTAAILGYGDLKWGNILITRVYLVEGLGHNQFSVGQFCDSDLEGAFRTNTCFVRNLEGVDLSWLWHQCSSHLNFDTINDLAKNDLVTGPPKFKYNKEHLFPLCEQGKSKKASHPPKTITNSKQRLDLLHMDLCGPMRVEIINGRRYNLVIVDDYSRYTWVHFLRSKDEAP